jgi:hypothetical protein
MRSSKNCISTSCPGWPNTTATNWKSTEPTRACSVSRWRRKGAYSIRNWKATLRRWRGRRHTSWSQISSAHETACTVGPADTHAGMKFSTSQGKCLTLLSQHLRTSRLADKSGDGHPRPSGPSGHRGRSRILGRQSPHLRPPTINRGTSSQAPLWPPRRLGRPRTGDRGRSRDPKPAGRLS